LYMYLTETSSCQTDIQIHGVHIYFLVYLEKKKKLTAHSAKLLFLLQEYPMFILVFQRNIKLAHKIEGQRHMEKVQWHKGIMTISMTESLYMPEISDTGQKMNYRSFIAIMTQSTDTPTYVTD